MELIRELRNAKPNYIYNHNSESKTICVGNSGKPSGGQTQHAFVGELEFGYFRLIR